MSTYIKVDPIGGGSYSVDPNNVPSSGEIEANKEVTINVSTYTSPVEITPTQGKDGMAKTTVTLSNIPSGGSAVLYNWIVKGSARVVYLNIDVAPYAVSVGGVKYLSIDINNLEVRISNLIKTGDTYTYASDTKFTISYADGSSSDTFTRNTQGDMSVVWESDMYWPPALSQYS